MTANHTITISGPYIEDDVTKGFSRLSAQVTFPLAWEGCKTLYYELQTPYKDFFASDCLDAFVVGILPFAMSVSDSTKPLTLVIDGVISAKLFGQLKLWYVPIIAGNMPDYYGPIKLEANQVSRSFSQSHFNVATGISGGVDSTYTLSKYSDQDTPDTFRLTHGLYFDFSLDTSSKMPDKKMDAWANLSEEIASLYHVDTFRIASNLVDELYEMVHDMVVSAVFCSYMLALQHGFSTFLFSSGIETPRFKLVANSMPHYALLNVEMFSTERLSIYSAGSECSRIQKVSAISKDERTFGFLLPCSATEDARPCSRCSKCTRTMCELYVLGQLDHYASVFDIDYFNNNPSYYWGYILMKKKTDSFCADIYRAAKKGGIRFSFRDYLSAISKWIRNGFNTSSSLATEYRPKGLEDFN